MIQYFTSQFCFSALSFVASIFECRLEEHPFQQAQHSEHSRLRPGPAVIPHLVFSLGPAQFPTAAIHLVSRKQWQLVFASLFDLGVSLWRNHRINFSFRQRSVNLPLVIRSIAAKLIDFVLLFVLVFRPFLPRFLLFRHVWGLRAGENER